MTSWAWSEALEIANRKSAASRVRHQVRGERTRRGWAWRVERDGVVVSNRGRDPETGMIVMGDMKTYFTPEEYERRETVLTSGERRLRDVMQGVAVQMADHFNAARAGQAAAAREG